MKLWLHTGPRYLMHCWRSFDLGHSLSSKSLPSPRSNLHSKPKVYMFSDFTLKLADNQLCNLLHRLERLQDYNILPNNYEFVPKLSQVWPFSSSFKWITNHYLYDIWYFHHEVGILSNPIKRRLYGSHFPKAGVISDSLRVWPHKIKQS